MLCSFKIQIMSITLFVRFVWALTGSIICVFFLPTALLLFRLDVYIPIPLESYAFRFSHPNRKMTLLGRNWVSIWFSMLFSAFE